jgi:hypothetical protein
MGRLTVGLNEQLKWPIDPPYADIIGQTLFATFPDAPRAFIFASSFVKAAKPLLELRDDAALAAAVAELADEEDSTMVVVSWEREIDQSENASPLLDEWLERNGRSGRRGA